MYFHELTDKQYLKLNADGKTMEEIAKLYKKPPWCKHKNPLSMTNGCFSLIHRTITNSSNCHKCPDFKPKHQ